MYKKIVIILIIGICVFGMGSEVFAAENLTTQDNAQQSLTIEQAFDLAITKSNTLKNSEYEIDRREEIRDSAADVAPTYTPQGSTPVVVSSAFVNLVNAGIELQKAEKTKTQEEQKLAISVFNEYINVLKEMDNLHYYQESFYNAQLQWNDAQLNFMVGTTSQVQRDASEAQFKAAQKTLEAEKIALAMAYQKFNKLLGLNPDDRPILTDRPAYSGIKVEDIKYEIGKALQNSLGIWTAEQTARMADISVDLYDFSDAIVPTESYSVKAINADKAKVSVTDARETLAQGVRDIYNGIMKLEESYNIQQEVLKTAENNLAVKKLMFEIGMATKTDVKTAELSLEKAKVDLNTTIYSHESNKLVFEKPWLIGATI